jgi:small subunit ribosomal protein S1
MSPGKFPDVQWEEDDKDFGQTKDQDDGAEFASMLEKEPERDARFLVGEKIKGTVAMIPQGTGTDILIDLGASKASAIVEKIDLQDEAGNLKVKVGDVVELFVISKKGGEILLSTKMSASLKSAGDIENAFNRKTPVRGKVAKVVKGGFEVTVLGKPAFCPVSQLDLRFVEDPTVHVGQEYDFQIEKYEEGGRNVVLSRAVLLRAQAEERLKELMKTLKPDTILDGVVTEVRDFGAFVDIGGVDGLVHVSALSFARVVKASDVVHKGDKVRVKVLKIENEGGKPKISLSMKATAVDPWDEIHRHVEGGKSYSGRVTNLMPFGAFIEIAPGIEGLLHVSEMSWMKRVHHPSEIVKPNDRVTVTVKDIDTNSRRISPSMKAVEDDPWFDAETKYPAGRSLKAPVEKLKPFGALVELAPGLSGLLPMAVIKRKFGEAYRQPCTPGKELEVRVVQLDKAQRKVLLTLEGVEEENADHRNYLDYLEAEKAAAKTIEAEQASAAPAAPKKGSFGDLLSAKLGQKR